MDLTETTSHRCLALFTSECKCCVLHKQTGGCGFTPGLDSNSTDTAYVQAPLENFQPSLTGEPGHAHTDTNQPSEENL